MLDLALVPLDDDLMQRALDWSLRLDREAAYDSFYLALAEMPRLRAVDCGPAPGPCC